MTFQTTANSSYQFFEQSSQNYLRKNLSKRVKINLVDLQSAKHKMSYNMKLTEITSEKCKFLHHSRKTYTRL